MSCSPTGNYSLNRSACYASLKNYKQAIIDADKTIELKQDWPKGYSRKGAALHGLGDYREAAEAYKKGLEVDPNNALLKKSLEDVEKAMESDTLNGLGNIFGPDVFTKMASNPRLSPFLAQPDICAMLSDCQKDPKNMSKYMQDQRMMQIMLGLMGLDGSVATNDDELQEAKDRANVNLEKREEEAKKQKVSEPEPEVNDEEMSAKRKREASDKEKDLGNQSYKKRDFDNALKHYDSAWEADETNVAVLTNKAGDLY
jgi:stress-induced-phosphoprotein 1